MVATHDNRHAHWSTVLNRARACCARVLKRVAGLGGAIRKAGIAHAPPRKPLVFAVVLAGVMIWSLAAGAATTITTVVNSDPAMCGRLLQMIKAARLSHMTDKQLCEFHFSQLPPSVTQGFTFLHWHRLKVADGPALYVKMLRANRAPGSVATEPDYARERQHAEEAARKGVLAFYTTQIPVSAVTPPGVPQTAPTAGSNQWTVLSMRETKCPSAVLPWMAGRYGDYSIFEQPKLHTPVPINIAVGGSQLALWYGKLVLIYVSPSWTAIGPEPPGIYVSLDNFWWSPGGEGMRMGMTGGTHCGFSIDKTHRSQ